jgi:low temperature requirement protein LtrA
MPSARTRIRARDITENHRVASPLEILFDLTFVIAIASLVSQLAYSIEEGHADTGIGPFLMVFSAIWWAWHQFTWVASAYGSDGVLFRVLTLVQMGGVLVLAAGVPAAFQEQDFAAITLGYLLMRVGLIGVLLVGMHDDPATRPMLRRYVTGIAAIQALWLIRLLVVPPEFSTLSLLILSLAELLVPPWAGRAGDLAWHPHHIAERYGLFTIILLGESAYAVTAAVQGGTEAALSPSLVVVAITGLVLLFALWWLYFSEPAAAGLVRRRERSFIWGYGHYFVFACLAAIGVALEVAVVAVSGHIEASAVVVGYALAIPIAVFLLLLWLLHAPLAERVSIPPVATVMAAVLVLAAPMASNLIGVVGVTVLIAAITVGLLVVALLPGAGFSRGRRQLLL